MAREQALFIALLTGAVAASSYDTTKNVEDTIANQATYHLTIQKDLWEAAFETLVLTRGSSVNQTLGPETAVYCKLTDPTEQVIFEGFGRCNLALDRVTNDHAGTWTMTTGLLGTMLTREYHITVQVRGSEHKPTVTTYVAKERPEVTLTCSVTVEHDVQSCLFQEPSGRVILASEGLAEDRYIYHGAGTTSNADMTTHECGLRITNPVTADLGLWRCAIQTDHEIYYGFLTVLCPWAMQDPATAAAVVSEPTLTAHKEDIIKREGDRVAMSCSIQSPIRYCYFRASNGTVFNVSPGLSSENFEYIGAGLDAGECGIRFNRLLSTDAGRWSCHVGLPDSHQLEQRVNIQVQINRAIEVNQYFVERGLRVVGEVYQNQPLEYCRYVRMDGLGFTTDTLPVARYFNFEELSRGYCAIKIEDPNILEMHPWTIAAKIVGQDQEVSGVTTHTIHLNTHLDNNNITFWCLMIFAGILLTCVGILIIPPKNRKRTIARVTAWRESFRSSIRKMPLPDDDVSRTKPTSA